MQLNDIPKNQSIFHTPEGYFDTLPQKVARKIRQSEKKTVSLWIALRLAYAVPAMAVVIAVVVGVYRLQPTDNQVQPIVSVEELLLENDISEAELLDYYVTQATENQDSFTMDELLYDISEDEVEQLIR
jgi:hypothetical protein